METETNTPQPYIINTGGGGAVKPIVIGVLSLVGLYFGNKAYKNYQQNQAEKNLDTPEGQIALQLKNVFDSTIVSDEEFRKVYVQVNNSNKDAVFKQYRMLTSRNLSDDIANHIGADTLVKTTKTDAINSKKNGVIKINANEDIEFLVAKGSKVIFTDPSKAVTVYYSPLGLLWNLADKNFKPQVREIDKIKVSIINRKDSFIVNKTLILPYNGVKLAEGWTKYFRQVVSTRKVFAIVQIAMKDSKGITRYPWVNAVDLSTTQTLKGIEDTSISLAF